MNKIYRTLVITLLLSLGSVAINAAPVIPNSGLIMRGPGGLIMRESSKMPTMPKKPIDTQIETPPLKKPMAAQSNLRVTVRSFNFSGNSQFPTSILQSLLTQYTNRELSLPIYNRPPPSLPSIIETRGFLVAYAYLPEQTLEQGQVELAIFEGRLDDQHLTGQGITLLNETRINKRIVQNFLGTLPKGTVITEDNMNHLSLLLNQLPGINAKVVLAPGQETGTSSLSVKIKEAPLLSGYLSTDNYGLYSTGYYRLMAE